MSRSKELAKNTIILTVGKLCTQFVSFFLLPLYTAILAANEYGVADLFAAYVSLLLPLVCWQFDQGIFRFMIDVRGDQKKIRELFSSITLTNVFQCICFGFLFFLAQFFIRSEYKYYLLASVILNMWASVLMQFSRGLGKMLYYSVGSFITATSTVVLNVIFLVFLHMGAHGLFRSTLLAICINIVYLTVVLKTWRYFDIRSFKISIVKEVAAYSLPLIPNQISGWVLNASDRAVISHFLGLTYNGIYAIAYKFSSLVATFYGFFNMAWVEIASVHFNDEDRDSFIQNMIQTALSFFCSVCLCIIAVMPFVFPIMIDKKYDPAFYHIPILLVAVIFQITVGLFSSVYIALKNSVDIAKTTLLGAVLNLVVHLSLIKFMGLYAASVSTLVSYAIVAVYRGFDIKRYVNIKLRTAYIAKIAAAFAIVIVFYYMKITTLNILALIFAVLFSVYLNREFLQLILLEIQKRLKKK